VCRDARSLGEWGVLISPGHLLADCTDAANMQGKTRASNDTLRDVGETVIEDVPESRSFTNAIDQP
jgi:hypothetical protein